jgi:hypothetical protein
MKKENKDFSINFKEALKKTEKFDLSLKYPGYIKKNIIRFFLFLIFLIVVADTMLNPGFVNLTFECPDSSSENCINPFFECDETHFINCEPVIPAYACRNDFCHKQYLPPGYVYERTDIISRFGKLFILLALPLGLLVNHLYYQN